MKLYKYYSNQKYALKDIKKNLVHLSSPDTFNDGFEATLFSDISGNHERINELYILCLTQDFLNQNMWGNYANSGRGLCIEYDVDDTIVSHVVYTDEKVTASGLEDIFDRASIKDRKISKGITLSKKIALLKSTDWKHEKEMRIVLDKTDDKLVECKNHFCIELNATSMYIGEYYDKSLKISKKVFEICNKKGIDIYTVEKSKTNRRLKKGHRYVHK